MYVARPISEIAGWRRLAGGLRVPREAGLTLALMLAGIVSTAAGGTGPAGPPPASTLVLAGRTVAQDQGAWVIEYRLRHAGATGVVILPDEVAVKVEGWVSNSRVASHAVPRHSLLAIARGPDLSAVSRVIAAADEEHRCGERLTCQLFADRCPSGRDATRGRSPAGSGGARAAEVGPRAKPLSLAPGDVVNVRLRLEHHHVIFGNYDPLLGVRAVEIVLGGATVRDVVPLDREHYLAQPHAGWPEPPDDRRDTKHAISGPDSLHLEAHVPGHHYYRFPDRPVRYGTPMRLRFWYLIAAGTEGECRFRVAQYKDTPTSWRMLNEAGFEKELRAVGRWTRVEHIFTTDAEATTMALDFRIAGDTDVGEMWIDDVSLEPVGCPGHGGP